ncbi:MAG: hypothetical protein FWC10_06770, partial [Lentimicrobiaceae bacterium]|nr:hypothetical protein [Lentimicrobiaceae bacterium]
MREVVIILATISLIAVGCGQTRNKANEYVAETPQDTLLQISGQSEKNDFSNKLHEIYQYFVENIGGRYANTEYYKDIDYIGLGVVNPKDFRFQLTTDTPDQPIIEIDIEEQELLIPIFWKPDYVIFYMAVVEISDNQYRVQANNKMTVWVNKGEFDFYTWEDLFKK